MNNLYFILSVAGWAWLVLVALFLVIRLRIKVDWVWLLAVALSPVIRLPVTRTPARRVLVFADDPATTAKVDAPLGSDGNI